MKFEKLKKKELEAKREELKALCTGETAQNEQEGERVLATTDFDSIAKEFQSQFFELIKIEFKMLKDGKTLRFNRDLFNSMKGVEYTDKQVLELAKLAKEFKDSKEP